MNEFKPDYDVSDEIMCELMQENRELKSQLSDHLFALDEIAALKAQLAEQLVYTNELKQLIRAGFMQGGKYRDLLKSESEDVFNTLDPSPELIAQHDADVIDKAREEAIKGKLNNWSKSYILLGEYAGKLRKGEIK